MSITDDISSQVQKQLEEGVTQAVRATPNAINSLASGTAKTAKGAVSGICLVVKAPYLTANAIMSVVGELSHNPKYSKSNISIQELEKNSDIKKIDERITKDVMKYFDAGCKKYGVTYTAVADKSNPKDPTYYVFFKGKETAIIEQVMKESYQKFMKEQAKPRFSIRAKLAFFRNRVADRDREQQDLGKEKHNNRADRQR